MHRDDGGVDLRTLLAAVLVLCVGGCGIATQDNESKLALDASTSANVHIDMRELTVSEKAILADGFTSGLNDPDSVKFKWAKVPKLLSGAGAPFEYCAQLDMKNAKGTYNRM